MERYISQEKAHWNAEGVCLLNEWRRTGIHLLPNKEWLLLVDLLLTPGNATQVTFGKTPFGLIGVRMAKPIGVHDGGNSIHISEGGVNERQIGNGKCGSVRAERGLLNARQRTGLAE
jgi:hypothetical protein